MASFQPPLFIVAGLLLLLSAGIIGFAVYLTSLDKEIRARFAGARWALPAQVYAAPLELYPGLGLDAATLKHELERLGYREQAEPQGPGTFAVTKDQALVHTRAFRFWDGLQPESHLQVRLAPAGITEVNDAESAAAVAVAPAARHCVVRGRAKNHVRTAALDGNSQTDAATDVTV